MGAHGSSYSRFRKAIDAGHASVALMAAAELERLTLPDALDLLVLLARDAHPRFEAAALRWVSRFAAEQAKTVQEIIVASGAVLELRVSERAFRLLGELADRNQPEAPDQ